jgi:DnaJ-domain-containing protein 1
MTYYDILFSTQESNRITPTFSIDLKKMKDAYLALQQRVHPDAHSTSSSVRYHVYNVLTR